MARKDFDKMETGRAMNRTAKTGLYNTTEKAASKTGQQGKAGEVEQQERAERLATQGRKGCKATRINMAFTPANYDYIRVMARVSGKTMTEFTNFMLDKYREEHQEQYNQAKEIIDSL